MQIVTYSFEGISVAGLIHRGKTLTTESTEYKCSLLNSVPSRCSVTRNGFPLKECTVKEKKDMINCIEDENYGNKEQV